jgi:hypothetical protein
MKQPLTIEKLKKLINPVQDFNFYFICHPDNLEALKKAIPPHPYDDSFCYYHDPYGIEIRTDIHLNKYAQRWQFPVTPFVEYEKSDEAWAIPLGFGKWVDTKDLLFYKINRGFIGYDLFLKPIHTKKALFLSSL